MPRYINPANYPQFTGINLLVDPGAIGGPVVVPNGTKIMPVWLSPGGKITRNVIGGINSGNVSITSALAETIFSQIKAHAATTALLALFGPGWQLARIEMQDIRNAHLPVVASTGAAVPGTAATVALPSEVALVATLRTAEIGVAARGRIYQQGWAAVALGSLDAATAGAVTALGAYVSALMTIFSNNGLPMGLIQPARQAYTGISGTPHPARNARMLPVTAALVRDNHWDSQRRRGLK